MARGVNRVFLIGTLGKDPEVRFTQNGTAVCNFSLATSERVKVGEEWQDKTEWHNIVLFGKTATATAEHLHKGSTCYIEGKIQTRKWQDKDGGTRYTTEIIGNAVQFIGGNNKTEAKPHDATGGIPDYDPGEECPF